MQPLVLDRCQHQNVAETEICTTTTTTTNNNNNKQKPTANADCKQFDETVEHVISACPTLAKKKTHKGHDKECVLNYTLTYARKQR